MKLKVSTIALAQKLVDNLSLELLSIEAEIKEANRAAQEAADQYTTVINLKEKLKTVITGPAKQNNRKSVICRTPIGPTLGDLQLEEEIQAAVLLPLGDTKKLN